MRLYGKRFLRNRTQRQLDSTIETRDAIVWEVYPEQRLAWVKIQGSDTPIVAQYPLNWETSPVWLKKQNSCKINFVAGNRGRVELIGHGATVPTPIASAPLSPTTGDDGVMSGGEVTPESTPSMTVNVAAGSVRIDGEAYSFDADTVEIAAAPGAGQYRYDLIVVGADGVIDYIEGTPSYSEPSVPSVPANHVEIGRPLVWHNSTVINSTNFGTPWTTPYAYALSMTASKDHMHWEDMGSSTITLKVLDQYGEAITPAEAGYDHYDFTVSWIAGNGNIDGTAAQTPVSKSGGGASSATFAYTRNNLPGDATAVLYGTVNTVPILSAVVQVLLLNDLENEMWGGETGNVIGPIGGSTEGNLPQFSDDSGQNLEDSGVAIADVQAAISAMHDEATAGTGISLDGQEVSLAERTANLSLFPEYPGAVMSPSGSNNDPGELGMVSDFEAISNTIYNYYEWISDVVSGLQSYDINVKIPIPFNFIRIPTGSNVALTIDIKTEENAATNNKIDVTVQRDGNAATSALTGQYSASAATWETIGFDDSNAVLAALVAGDTLNVTIRMYSQNSKYSRIGKINLQMTVQ